jgi:hypothetical protein
MASKPPSVAATAAPSNNRQPKTLLVPPDEQFWQRYSPHHEAPLSGIGSFAAHFVIGGFLILAGYLGWLGLGSHRAAVANDAVRLELQGGGGGDRRGKGDGPGDGSIGHEEVADAPQTDKDQTPIDPTKRPELDQPVATSPETPPIPQNDNVDQIVKSGNEYVASARRASADIQEKLRIGLQPAGKGKGGNGSGGGSGNGNGTADGDKSGNGRGGNLTQREKRMLRWDMKFEYGRMDDYLRQLKGLGAILAIPKERGATDYWVIRDLGSRQAKLLDEDVTQLHRIYWEDHNPRTVEGVLHLLGVRVRAEYFVAFMPQELEDKLFEDELKYRGMREDDILETTFEVRFVGGKYIPVVVAQKAK